MTWVDTDEEGLPMLKAIIFAVAVGTMTTLFAVSPNAQSLGLVNSHTAIESNVILVRDGCGRGRHYSRYRDRCVDDERYGSTDGYRSRREMCQERCLRRREICNERRGGYFNGCGIEGAACIKGCDL